MQLPPPAQPLAFDPTRKEQLLLRRPYLYKPHMLTLSPTQRQLYLEGSLFKQGAEAEGRNFVSWERT